MADVERIANAIVRLNDEDWETWDNRTEFESAESWPISARDLRDAIAAVLVTEREVSDRAVNEAVDAALERAATTAERMADTFCDDGHHREAGAAEAVKQAIRRLKSPANPETV